MRILLYLIAAVVVAGVAFVAHVPILRYISTPSQASGLLDYAHLADGVEGQDYLIEQILYGHTLQVLYDPATDQYLVIAEFVEPDPKNYADRYLITLAANGAHINTRGIGMDELDTVLDDPTYVPVPKSVETQYPPNYDFDRQQGAIELLHYQYKTFKDWPGLYYYVPVVYSDWGGTAFLKVAHQSEVFSVQLPTDYYGGFLYGAGNVDGQVYMRARDGETSGLAFLEVGESSYTSDMDGHETHRGGYGLYVIRRK